MKRFAEIISKPQAAWPGMVEADVTHNSGAVSSTATPELTAVISKIMMYVLIVLLQLWLIGILVYCYKKTAAEQEAREARQALKAQAEWVISFNEEGFVIRFLYIYVYNFFQRYQMNCWLDCRLIEKKSVDPPTACSDPILFASTRLEEHLCNSEEGEADAPWFWQYGNMSAAEVGFVDLYIGLLVHRLSARHLFNHSLADRMWVWWLKQCLMCKMIQWLTPLHFKSHF